MLLEIRNVLTMREDIEQKSNDHHPVLCHWRVGVSGKLAPGSLQLNDPSPATSSLHGLTQIGWATALHKVGKTELCTQPERLKFSRFLLSHLFFGYSSLMNTFGRFEITVLRKTFIQKVSLQLISSSVGH